jgi:transketolase
VQKFKDPKTWDLILNEQVPTFIAAEELADLADVYPNIVALTADVKTTNRMWEFAERHPDRFFNFGIAEQNMVTSAAGMASCGNIPYVMTIASFLALLCCEQIRTDCAYTFQKVRILAHHSGMSMGQYTTSHHALEDLSIMRTLANMTVVAPADANETRAVLRASIDHPGPMYIRLGRGRDPDVHATVPADFRIGKAMRLREGKDITIIAIGSEVHPALEAAEHLAALGISTRVVEMHTIKPLDRDEILSAAGETAAVMVVEEHNITGGLGSAVAEVLADAGVSCRFRRHGVDDEYVPVGPPRALYAHYRLDADGIVSVAKQFLDL